jgi:hypothetical protein
MPSRPGHEASRRARWTALQLDGLLSSTIGNFLENEEIVLLKKWTKKAALVSDSTLPTGCAATTTY